MFQSRNLWTSSLLSGAAVFLWLAGFAGAAFGSASVLHYPIWLYAVQVVLVIALLFLINNTVEHYALTANLCNFAAVFFMLGLAGFIPLYMQPSAVAAAMLCLFGYRQLFDCYKKNDCNTHTFNAFFLFALASLPVPPLIWMIPVMWVAYSLVNNLSVQRFLSSIAGIALLAWIVWGILFLTGNTSLIHDEFGRLTDGFALFSLLESDEWASGNLWLKIGLAAYVLLSVISFVSFLHGSARRHSVKNYTLFLHIVWWCLMVLMLCYPSHALQLLFLSLVPFAISVGQLYFEHDTLFTRILFCLWLASVVMSYVNGDGPPFPTF